MFEKELLSIGLAKDEAAVYTLLAEAEEALASDIARKTSVSRPHVYDSLNRLVKRGLVGFVIKNNRKYFKASRPERLLDYLREKKDEIIVKEKAIKKIIPELAKLRRIETKAPQVEVYQGAEGLKTVLNMILREAKEIYTFGASDQAKRFLPEFFIKKYLRERARRGIIAKQLHARGVEIYRSKHAYFRELPKEFASPVTNVVFDDKLATFIWTEIPIVSIVKSKEVALAYKEYFNLLWNIANPSK